MRWRNAAVYGFVLATALWLNSTFAQSVPTFEDGHWVLPAPESAGMGPDPVAAQGGYEAAIYDACARYGCDGAQLVRVANCESGMNPNAVGAQGEVGLFQIKMEIWGVNAWDPYASIDFAAQMFASGQGYNWVCQ
jgi:soluble lytic murein transglycosylase-like protein